VLRSLLSPQKKKVASFARVGRRHHEHQLRGDSTRGAARFCCERKKKENECFLILSAPISKKGAHALEGKKGKGGQCRLLAPTRMAFPIYLQEGRTPFRKGGRKGTVGSSLD